jgi:hypothetical protein
MEHEPNYNFRHRLPPVAFYDTPIVVGLLPYAQFCQSIDHQLARLEAQWAREPARACQGKSSREVRGSSTPSPAE